MALAHLYVLQSCYHKSFAGYICPLEKTPLLSQPRTSALITPRLLSLQTLADLQLITTQHRLIIWLTSYALEVISEHPKMSSQQSVHIFHLVMALTKKPEAQSTRGTFGPLSLRCIGLWSHPLMLRVSCPILRVISDDLLPTFHSHFLEKSISWQNRQFRLRRSVKKSMCCILSNLLIYSLSFDDYAFLTILWTLMDSIFTWAYMATSTFNLNWRDVEWGTWSFVSIVLNVV